MRPVRLYVLLCCVLFVTVIPAFSKANAQPGSVPECNLAGKDFFSFVEKRLGSLGRTAQFDTPIVRGGRSSRLYVRDKNESQHRLFFKVMAIPSSFMGTLEQEEQPTIPETSPRKTILQPAIRGIERLGHDTPETGDERTVLVLAVPNLLEQGWSYLFWPTLTYYIAACPVDGSAITSMGFVAVAQARVSHGIFVSLLTFSLVALVYLLAAAGVRRATTPAPTFTQSLNPFRLTAGISGSSSISNLQIFTFSLIVFGLLVFVLLRTGELSDISANVAWLLGIVGVGTSAARFVASQREQLSPANFAWLLKRRWLKREPSIAQLITQGGEFSVTRFQSIAFSLIVAIALLVSGPAELATFTIPESILGLLVASQAIYIGGKWVQPRTVNQERFAELNTLLDELRELEGKLIDEKPAALSMQAFFASSPAPSTVSEYKNKAGTAANKLAWEFEVPLPTAGIDGLPL